ncbi:autophagy-related 18a isoform e [Anaeramoeba ignava]|uniref:Autophagy-related 18a isoform e n=1 Tax=Anaeramoeba ignava TaxID=1746090 RepID=A0A9Q0LGP6_ANAIG|nr:autophagy-related 18a isoform e [Anaeramoeba ignava]|eukprot:Anaeramoba_ignava/a93851_63.p1 GENE.a93851_63~~a93851_63.p1  ORF type:complete len:332 (+),score=118.37 a93851_63:3-998(+)
MNLFAKRSAKHSFINFSQDNTRALIGIENKLKIFKLENLSLEVEIETGPIFFANTLFSSSLLLYTTQENMKEIKFYSMNQNKEITKLSFEKEIYNYQFNSQKLVILFKDEIVIYSINDLKKIGQITVDSDKNNKNRIIGLSNNERSLLAYPEKGKLILYDTNQMSDLVQLKCHNTPISSLIFNENETLIATTSDNGKFLRVFEIPKEAVKQDPKSLKSETTPLIEFKRGSSVALVYNIHFSLNSKFILLTSERGTTHIFKMPDPNSKSNSVSTFVKVYSKKTQFHLVVFNLYRLNRIVILDSNGLLFIHEFDEESGKSSTLSQEVDLKEAK